MWLPVTKLVLVVNYFSFCQVHVSLLPVTHWQSYETDEMFNVLEQCLCVY